MKRFILLVLVGILLTVGNAAADMDVDVDRNNAMDVEYGGTNATTAAGARANLGVQAELAEGGFVDGDKTKLDSIESGATGDQTDEEIETAYNNRVAVVSQVDAEAGTSTTPKRWTPERVAQAITALAGGGGGTDTIGWDYTVLSSAPASPVAGKIYWADNEAAGWDPITLDGTDDYAVLYTGSNYIGIVDIAGNLVVSEISGALLTAGTVAPESLSTTADDDGIQFVIDGGGSVITTGTKGCIEIPWSGTISTALAAAPLESGSISVDIWVDSFANFPPTDADSITASAPVAISSAQTGSSALTGWTTTATKGDWMCFHVDTVTTLTNTTISLKVDK